MRHFAWFVPLLLLGACAPEYPGDSGPKTDAAAGPDAAPVKVAVVAPIDPADEAKLRGILEKRLGGARIDAIRGTPIAGVYEVQSGMLFGYTSADGRYLIEGDLNDLERGERLTENSRKTARAALVAKVSNDQSIEFLPKEQPAKYHVTVFTDVDCGYCRMFHQHIAEYNAEGIAVRYLFFPRSGANTPSFYKAEEVWCSADRQQALTDAKQGKALTAGKDCKNPIAEHLALAGQLGLRGTPAILLEDGEMIPGYQAPAALLNILASHDPNAATAAPAGPQDAAPAPG